MMMHIVKFCSFTLFIYLSYITFPEVYWQGFWILYDFYENILYFFDDLKTPTLFDIIDTIKKLDFSWSEIKRLLKKIYDFWFK